MAETSRHCIFVLGMHRSGTSALTGALKLMGVELGGKLMGPWKGDNPKGFFENMKFFRLNEKFLKQCGSSWDDPCFYGEDWLADRDIALYKEEIKDLSQDEFADYPLCAVKDPRISILFPVWKEVFDDLAFHSLCALSVRNPMEVALSLHKRDGFPLEQGLLLWMNHMLSAELLSRGMPRVFVLYEELIEEPEKVLSGLAARLNLAFPRSWKEAGSEVERFLDRGLRHHRQEDAADDNPMSGLVAQCYTAFSEAAAGEGDTEAICQRIDELRRQYEQYLHFFYNRRAREMLVQGRENGRLLDEERGRVHLLNLECSNLRTKVDDCISNFQVCEKKVDELERRLVEITGSRSWKIVQGIKKVVRRNSGG